MINCIFLPKGNVLKKIILKLQKKSLIIDHVMNFDYEVRYEATPKEPDIEENFDSLDD